MYLLHFSFSTLPEQLATVFLEMLIVPSRPILGEKSYLSTTFIAF